MSCQLEPNLAYTINTSVSKLELTTLPPPPAPGPNQSLIRIHAAALNYRDILVTTSSPRYPPETCNGLVPCSDGAGTVVSTSSSSPFQPGDVVIPHPNGWLRGTDVRDFRFEEVLGGAGTHGTLQRYMLVDDDRLVRAPRNLSVQEAAALGTAMGTAVNALFWGPDGTGSAHWKVQKGMTVLTQGTGGVSCAAIQVRGPASSSFAYFFIHPWLLTVRGGGFLRVFACIPQ